jgi:membrane-bound transcription factor site-1 protease
VQDVATHGLGLLLFPEWYSLKSMSRMHFFDDNTRSWWTPVTGGSNIPAVNDLVAPFGLAFGDKVVHGSVVVGKTHTLPYTSGTHIIKAPAGSRLLEASLKDHSNGTPASSVPPEIYNVLGLIEHGAGRIAAFGDASCVDANHAVANCHALLLEMLQWATDQAKPPWGSALKTLDAPLGQPDMELPARPSPNLLEAVSFVANHPEPICFLNSARGMQLAAQQQVCPLHIYTVCACCTLLVASACS